MRIFIDTNIYLSFLHYTSDELEELEKLSVLLKQGIVTLYLTAQVKDEFYRNRESKLADALKRVREQRLAAQLPNFCKEYAEYTALRDAQKAYDRAHADLLRKVTEDALARKLRADSTIEQLFSLAKLLTVDNAVMERASQRAARGNPPGKPGSLGDAINWEVLLQSVPTGEDIVTITDDRDYASQLAPEAFPHSR